MDNVETGDEDVRKNLGAIQGLELWYGHINGTSKRPPINISIFLKEAINNGHNGHIYGVKKQETNDELNQTFPKTSITAHEKQEIFDVPVVFIHSQVQILLKIHWKDPVSQGCSDVFSLTEQTFYNIGSWRNPMQLHHRF